MGYRVGQRLLELIVWREKNSRRETRILGILQFIHTVVWKTLFGKPADSLEKSTEHDDECTIPRPCIKLTSRHGSRQCANDHKIHFCSAEYVAVELWGLLGWDN